MNPRATLRSPAAAILLGLLLQSFPPVAGPARASLGEELRDGLSSRFESQGFVSYLDLRVSDLNRNNLLGLPRYQGGIDLRPKLGLDLRRLHLAVAPRYEGRWNRFEEGPRRGGSVTADDWFLNGWEARLEVSPRLLASLGRANLQWGPSYLLSPSNPFNRGNGQDNPRVELPGLDYARLLWVPSLHWTVSVLANTGRGRLRTLRPFVRSVAMKTDFVGNGAYASTIVSTREGEDTWTVGGYGGWTVSDAVLVHGEAALPGDTGRPDLLGGGVYTFPGGAFLAVEVYHHGSGCDAENIARCFNPLTGRSDPAEVLFRRNYLMLQATHPSWRGRIHATARWVAGLDDGSHRLLGIVERDLGRRARAFLIGDLDLGSVRDEFGAVASGALMSGVSWVL